MWEIQKPFEELNCEIVYVDILDKESLEKALRKLFMLAQLLLLIKLNIP